MTEAARARRSRWWTPAIVVAAIATGSVPMVAAAQQRPAGPPAPRAPAVIEGAAATPQLVTVRPREPLRFDAQLLVPLYYTGNFWPAILAGVDVAPPRAPAAAESVPPVAPAAAPRSNPSPSGRAGPAARRRPPRQAPPR